VSPTEQAAVCITASVEEVVREDTHRITKSRIRVKQPPEFVGY
jgi:hypothetical protein